MATFAVSIAVGIAVFVVLILMGLLYLRRRSADAQGTDIGSGHIVRQRDTVILIGPTGSGKTVLLHQVR